MTPRNIFPYWNKLLTSGGYTMKCLKVNPKPFDELLLLKFEA